MEWKSVPISSICEGIYEGPHATPPSCDSGAYYLGIPALTIDGQIDFSKVPFISKEDYIKWTKRVTPQYGDIVFTNEATLNLYARIPKGFYGCLGRRLGLVRPSKNKVDTDYLFYYFFSPFWRNVIAQKKVSGSTVERILMKKFPRFPVLLPPLTTQRRIASILSAYDNLIENNNKRIRLLEQMAENLYKEWFVRFRFPGHEKVEMENGLPKGWKIERVKAIVKRLPFNRTYKEEELEKTGKVVVIDQSTNDVLGYHNNEPSHYANYNNPLMVFGDHSCKFQLMTQNFSLGENVIPFTTCDNSVVNEYWLFYATHKLIKTEEYKRHWGRFSSMKVLIPKIGLQNKFADIIVSLEKEKNKLKAENDNLSRQRDLLLPRLMSGKLEVKE